jgi:hypothetical protein
MKKKELKKQIEDLAQKVAFMSEKMYKLETYLIDLQIKDAKKERNNPFGISNEIAAKVGLNQAASTPNDIRELQSEAAHQITESIDKLIKQPKRTMKDVREGDLVRYVTPMPEGTWMKKPWGIDDGLKVGDVYLVIEVTEIAVIVVKCGKYVDKNCFEIANG